MAGFSFGAPGQFRFDMGNDPLGPGLVELNANSPANFGAAWMQIMKQLGLTNPSSSAYKWMQGMASSAKAEFARRSIYDKDLQQVDFFNQYVPGLAQQFGLLSAQERGEEPRFVGKPRFLG